MSPRASDHPCDGCPSVRNVLNGRRCTTLNIIVEYQRTRMCNQDLSIMAKTSVTLFEPQLMGSLAKLGPESYRLNTMSHDKCIEAGQALLDRIQREGMTDSLDMEVAAYIEKAKATVRKMNSRRTPITQLFDQIRKVYTSLENEVDPTKMGTVPAQLQDARNKFAARKREQAEAARRAEAVRIAHDNAVTKYRTDVQEDYKAQLNRYIISQINALLELDKSLTTENYNDIEARIRNFPVTLPDDWHHTLQSSVRAPYELTPQECNEIRQTVLLAGLPNFKEQYAFELTTNRDDLLDRLPSKHRELCNIAAADADKAAKLQAEMQERERVEAARKEQERIRRETEASAAAELQKQKSEMDGLFGAAMVAQPGYQPKTAVKKRLVPKNPEAFMNIVGLWWSQEGCTLSVDELAKIFKKQMTFCEKLANDKDSPMMIDSPNVEYIDEVKAK